MNPIHRIILMVVRLLAIGLFLAGTLKVMLYWADAQIHKTNLRLGRAAYLSIPAIIGALMLAASFPLASWLRRQDDDGDAD